MFPPGITALARFHNFWPVPIVAPAFLAIFEFLFNSSELVPYIRRISFHEKSLLGAKCSVTKRTTSRSCSSSTVQRRCEKSVSDATFIVEKWPDSLIYGVTCSRSLGEQDSLWARCSASKVKTSMSSPSGNVGGLILQR